MKISSISYPFAFIPFSAPHSDGDYRSRNTGNWFTASNVYQNQITGIEILLDLGGALGKKCILGLTRKSKNQ